ncbi:hypothetical protein [Bacteriovorax sp. Seq25_V]|uniref:hypothetical protein n=1 Tax=Bacteriovorax sp. Seq25_V TaxID=1201288 RepID=UPI00038A49E2|nr:hypothetical protein [Bacteriovorax sp. Seq25_V]EQC46155.1 hypothetical protein M900_1804 [Bacteriovorax sp. Seq25_V]
MKKLLTLALLSSMTFAATDSATLNLQGTVGAVVDISVAALSDATNLDLTQSQSNKKVATVTEQSNTTTHFTVSVSSANGGKLKNGTNDFSYSLSYGGQGVDLAAGTTFTRNPDPLNANNYDVNISYTGQSAASMVAGDYTDIVTFEIAAN